MPSAQWQMSDEYGVRVVFSGNPGALGGAIQVLPSGTPSQRVRSLSRFKTTVRWYRVGKDSFIPGSLCPAYEVW